MKPLRAFRRLLGNSDRSTQLLAEIREGIANLHAAVNMSLAEFDSFLAEVRESRSKDTALDAKGRPLVEHRKIIIDEDEHNVWVPSPDENKLEQFIYVFGNLSKREVAVPGGYITDFLGTLIDTRFLGLDPNKFPARVTHEDIPTLRDNDQGDGEWWFETVDWFVAAESARDRFVMISLGASYGAQLVGAYRALQIVNPSLPARLVAVEADPESADWIRQHFRDNGIDPTSHWIMQAAVSDTNEPVLFPVGAPGLGSNNCISTNDGKARNYWVNVIRRNGNADAALENLIRYGTTGLMHDLGEGHAGEVKFVSAVTLRDLLAQFQRVDLLECDIQQSEIVALPPFIDLLRQKVKRIHIGTHGKGIHSALLELFAKDGWDIVFNFPPNALHSTPLGPFSTNDGVLTVRNRDL